MESIDGYLKKALEKWGSKPYITAKINKSFCTKTFSEVIDDVCSVAHYLSSQYENNAKYIIYSENTYEWMILDLAIMGYCGVCIPVDKEWTQHDIENMMNFVKVDVMFYSASKSNIINAIKNKYTDTNFICIDESLDIIVSSGRANKNDIIPQNDLNRTVKIIFTSGTTAFPKAIPLTQANLFNNWETLYMRTPMTENDKTCIFLPLNHVYSGVANFLYTIISGMQIYLCDNIQTYVHDIIVQKPTVVCIVPLLLKQMYINMTPELLDAMKKIRFLYCGGSFTEPEVKRFFRKNEVNLIEAYGTTETSSVIALDIIGEECLESNGTIFENLSVKIDSPDEDGYGEILVSGGSRTEGYLNYPENNLYFDSDGYFHTGDIGKLDEKRRLFLKGRKKRMLNTYDGKNVYADEIEELLIENEAIKKARVYLDEYKIAALIYSNVDEKETRAIVDAVNKKLPEFKQIKCIYFSDDKIGRRIK